MSRITFPVHIRPHVEALAKLCMFANDQDRGLWASQGDFLHMDRMGVYGFAYYGIYAIIREVWGESVADEWLGCMEFGCAESYLADVEWGVERAIRYTKERERV
jgi:hypothetical protein